MLRAIFAARSGFPANLSRVLYALTEGNPYFIEETLKALLTAGDLDTTSGQALPDWRIPRSVQDAVQRRAERLSPAARQLLRLAAVAGRRFDFAVLQALTGQDEPALLVVLRELLDAQLVVEESADIFAFRHTLTRQAVCAELLERERRLLHRAVGEAQGARHAATPEPYLADLAYHFHAAEDWPRALEYATRAGEQARRLYAPGAAVEHFSRALDAAARLALPAPPALHRQRGLAFATRGEFAAARRDLETARDLAQQANDRAAAWQALHDLGALWMGYDYDRTGDYFRQALVLARATSDRPLVARSLAQLGGWAMNVERIPEARGYLEEALDVQAAEGDRGAVAETLDQLAMAVNLGADLARAAAHYRRGIALCRELGDRQGAATSLATLAGHVGVYQHEAVATSAEASLEGGRAMAEEALVLARAIGWRAGESYALLALGAMLGYHGHYGQALSLATEALTIARELEHHEAMRARRLPLPTGSTPPPPTRTTRGISRYWRYCVVRRWRHSARPSQPSGRCWRRGMARRRGVFARLSGAPTPRSADTTPRQGTPRRPSANFRRPGAWSRRCLPTSLTSSYARRC